MPSTLPLARPVLFPLCAIIDGACGCGAPGCTLAGKHPLTPWKDLEYPTPKPTTPGCGIRTGATPKGSDIIVVDADDEAAIEWVYTQCGGPPNTMTVLTSRGAHFYYEHPGFPVRNSTSEIAAKVDIRGDGGMVVGPGSPHKSGVLYELVDSSPPAPCPAWLLEWPGLREKARTSDAEDYAGDVTGEARDYHRALFTEYLKSAPPAIEKKGGDGALFTVVQRGAFDLSLPVSDVLELVREHYDPRCDPPWGDQLEERVRHKAKSAKTASTRAQQPPVTLATAKMLGHWKTEPSLGSPAIDLVRASAVADAPPALPSKDRFEIVHAASLATPVPPVEYIWRHFGIAPGRPSLLAGYGGAGKTIIVQALVLHMAAGLGTCWDLPILCGGVLHIDFEMTLDPIKRRYQRLAEAYRIDLASCDLHVISMPRIYLSSEPAEDALIEACTGMRVCVIDNLAAALGPTPIKENEAGVRNYLDLLTRVSKHTGCTCLVLVHERKAGKGEEGGGLGLQRVRGSSAITDASGSVISISPAEDGIVTVTHTKTSYRKKGDDLCLRIEDCGRAASEDEDAPGLRVVKVDGSSLPTKATKLSDIETEILKEVEGGTVGSQEELGERLSHSKRSIGAAVEALRTKHLLAKPDKNKYVADTPTKRRARILDHARRPGYTMAQLVRSADVFEDEVQAIVAETPSPLFYDSKEGFRVAIDAVP